MKNLQIAGILLSFVGLLGIVTNFDKFNNFPAQMTGVATGSLILFIVGLYLALREI